MAIFKYSAIDNKGKKVKGDIEAKSKSNAVVLLQDKSYIPISIEETVSRKEFSLSSLFNRITIKDLAVMSRQFQVMLVAGISVVKSLDILRYQVRNPNLRKRLEDMYESVQKGVALSMAMKNHRDVFPPLYIHMIEAGEASGSIDTIMDRLALHYEKEFKIHKKIKSAMIYPIILSVVSVAVVGLLLVFVMPMFIQMFADSGVELPLPTRILMAISNGLKKYWFFVIANVLFLIYLVNIYRKSDRGRNTLDGLKLRLPIVKGSIKKIVTTRFARTLAILLKSGIPLMDAIEIVSKVVQNKVVERGLLQTKEELRKGVDLSIPLTKLGFFPPMVISMVKIGEESGALDEILDKTANFYDQEVESAMQSLVALIEPAMIVLMAIIIGAIVVAMVLPMFDMYNHIKI